MLRDETAWVSHEVEKRVIARLGELVHRPDAAYEAGRFAVESGSFGTMEAIVRAILGPGSAYRHIGWITNRLTRAGAMTQVASRRQHAELRYCYHQGFSGTKAMCRNRQGLLAAIPTVWGLPPASVEELECAHEGGACCRYSVRWREPPVWRYRNALVLTSAATAALLLAVAWTGLITSYLAWAVIAVIQFMLIGWLFGQNVDLSSRAVGLRGVVRRQNSALEQ